MVVSFKWLWRLICWLQIPCMVWWVNTFLHTYQQRKCCCISQYFKLANVFSGVQPRCLCSWFLQPCRRLSPSYQHTRVFFYISVRVKEPWRVLTWGRRCVWWVSGVVLVCQPADCCEGNRPLWINMLLAGQHLSLHCSHIGLLCSPFYICLHNRN